MSTLYYNLHIQVRHVNSNLMSDIWGNNNFRGYIMILTSGDSISIFFRLLPYTTYIIPIASFIIAVVVGLSIRGKAYRIERDYTRTSADITSVRRVSKRTHIKYEYRDQSGVLHNGFLSVRGLTNYNSMSSIAIYYNPENPSASYTERTMNSDKNAPFIYGGAVLLGTLVFLWRRR